MKITPRNTISTIQVHRDFIQIVKRETNQSHGGFIQDGRSKHDQKEPTDCSQI